MPAPVPSAVVKAVTDRVGVTCLLAALVLLGCGATGQIPWVAPIKEPIFRWALTVLGALLLFPSVYLLVLEVRSRTSPSVVPSSPSLEKADPEKIGFVVTEPELDKTHGPSVWFAGSVKKQPPPGFEIWLVNQAMVGTTTTYWPQEAVHIRTGKKLRWSTPYEGRLEKPSETRTLRFLLVGPDGQKLFRLYKKINTHFATPAGLLWQGIIEPDLTSDIQRVGSSLTLKQEQTPP